MKVHSIQRRTVLKQFGLVSVSAAGIGNFNGKKSEASNRVTIRTCPLIEAHRGYSEKAPENTLAAFREAIQAGVDRIELDLFVSQDGHAVVIHDETVDRTTNGTGAVKEMTLRELKELDAGSWKDPRFAAERIPTFQEVLEMAKGRVLVDIDLKDTAAIEPMVGDLRKMDMLFDVIVTGTSREDIQMIRKVEPALAVFFERSEELDELHKSGKKQEFIRTAIRLAQESQAPGFNFDYNTLTPEFIREAHLRGLSVIAWTVNDPQSMEDLLAWGVDTIMTDRPDAAKGIVERRGFSRGA